MPARKEFWVHDRVWTGAAGRLGLPALAILLWSGRRENPSNFDRNFPPETYVSGAPAESTLSYYVVHLYWHGSDRDGSIQYYEYSITDSSKTPGEDTPDFSGYFRTSTTDSLFHLKADDPQVLGHRFYIRAVDNEGKLDPTPAWTYFVAHDYNFPHVDFTRGTGTWTDKFGADWRIAITSNERFEPRDTIGVGGCMEIAWSGHDVDVGGSVVGYEFRRSADTAFQGGAPGDTLFSTCFAGIGTPKPFSGREAIFVRAIDDAGAKTLPDSVRAVVVNFNPIALIVDPRSPVPIPARLFKDDRDVIRPSGVTLSDGGSGGRSISFAYTGYDDPRDAKRDPNDYGITGFSYRRLQDGGGQAYRNIPAGTWSPYPAVNQFALAAAQNLPSGDFLFLIRATDDLGRAGNPDSLLVSINYPPFFTDVVYEDEAGTEHPLWDPLGGTTITVTHPSGGGTPPPFHLKIRAIDTHSVENPHPLEVTEIVEDEAGVVDEYRVRINGAPDGFEASPGAGLYYEKFLPVSTDTVALGAVRPGCANTLELVCRDPGGKESLVVVSFCVDLE